MKSFVKRSLVFVLAVTMIIASFSSFAAATGPATSAEGGSLVVTGYTVSYANGNPVSRITKGDKINISLNCRHTNITSTDISDSSQIQISRMVDSFSGGDVPGKEIKDGGSLLEFDVTLNGIEYKGTGNTLKLMVGYNGAAGAQDYIEIPISQCKEYEEPNYEPEPPQQPDPSPAPMLIVSRSPLYAALKPNQETEITVYVKNTGSTTAQSPIISFAPSESLMLTGESTMMQLNSIGPGKTESVNVKVRALDTITAANQSLDASIKFTYFNRVSTVEGTSEGKIMIPAKVKKEADPEEPVTDSPVPNMIITKFNYGGESVAAGSKFRLSFNFKNTSKTLAVENVVVTVEGGEGFMINGSTNTFYFDKIKARGSKTISLPMKAGAELTNSAQPVAVNFKYEYVDHKKRTASTADLKISVPVYQPDKFEIEKPKLPLMVYAGEENSITMNYVNKSKGMISNVEAEITGNIEAPVTVQNIGNLEAGKSGTIAFAVTAFEAGEADFTIKVTYEDGNGEVKERIFPATLTVEEMEPYDPGMDEPMPEPQEENGNKLPLIIGACVIAAIIAAIVIKKKRKAAAARKEAEMWDNWDDKDTSYDVSATDGGSNSDKGEA